MSYGAWTSEANLNESFWVPVKYAIRYMTLEEPLLSMESGTYYVCTHWNEYQGGEATLRPAVILDKKNKKGETVFKEDLTKKTIRVKLSALKRKYAVCKEEASANYILYAASKSEAMVPLFTSNEGQIGKRRSKRISAS